MMPGAQAYLVDGSDVGVVICHGFTGTPASMMGLARVCEAQGWTVRLPLLPGHGTHWRDLNKTRWHDWAEEIEAATTQLLAQCRVVVVVGLSMGGTLATLMAERHADVDGLFLINPAFVMKDLRLRALPILHRVLPSIPAISGDIKKPGEIEVAYDRTPLRALHSQTQMWREVTDALPHLRQPAVLCHSPEDHVVPPECSELFLRTAGCVEIKDVVLKNSYHVATQDHDAELIEAELVAFVQRLAGQEVA